MLLEQLKTTLIPQEQKLLTPHEQLIASYGNLQQKLQELWEEKFILGKKGFPKKIREEIEGLFNPFIEPLSQISLEELSELLIDLLAQNSPEYAKHCERVGKIAYELAFFAGEQNPQTLRDIYYAGILHDIGKMMIPREILESKEKLTDEEKKIMKWHAYIGYLILTLFPQTRNIAPLVLQHHERFDGKGCYGISNKNINPNTWYIATVDIFDALTSKRRYKEGLSEEKSLKLMEEDKGHIPQNFLSLLKQFLSKKENQN